MGGTEDPATAGSSGVSPILELRSAAQPLRPAGTTSMPPLPPCRCRQEDRVLGLSASKCPLHGLAAADQLDAQLRDSKRAAEVWMWGMTAVAVLLTLSVVVLLATGQARIAVVVIVAIVAVVWLRDRFRSHADIFARARALL